MDFLARIFIVVVMLVPTHVANASHALGFIAHTKSSNWSGYAFQGGPFTYVSGTFTVPSQVDSSDCGGQLGEWVGIDGSGNQDLIQAGIAETPISPTTYYCNSQQVYVSAWWEILPSTFVTLPMIVTPGDSMTISIGQILKDQWVIMVGDNTTGSIWSQVFPYAGPASSAEWIVEAPVTGYIPSALLPFGTTTFNGLQLDGRAALMKDFWIQGSGGNWVSVAQSQPNAKTLMADGFQVMYTG